MATRYCIQCGTLLPEDGVCLRCGAVYFFADDGTMIVHPRKVKKVTAKPSPKKRVFVKRSIDSHEADTQTIPIPEDIFSRTEPFDTNEKHIDWTGNDTDETTVNEKGPYTPNFVLVDEKYEEKKSTDTEVDFDPFGRPEPDKSQYVESKKSNTRKWLVALFLLVAGLAAILTFQLISNEKNSSTDVRTAENTLTAIQTTSDTHANDYESASIPFSVKKAEYHEGYQESTPFIAEFRFDESSGRLEIDAFEEVNLTILLLTLFDDKKISERHATLASFYNEIDDYDVLLCESDFIRKGLIKELVISTKNMEQASESKRTLQLEVRDSKVYQVYDVTRTVFHYDTEPDGENTTYRTIKYLYDSKGNLSGSESQTTYSGDEFVWKEKKEYRYNSQGYLSEVFVKVNDFDVNYVYTAQLTYDNQLLNTVSVSSNNRATVTTYNYNSEGLLSNIKRQFSENEYDMMDSIEYDDNGFIKAVNLNEEGPFLRSWYHFYR